MAMPPSATTGAARNAPRTAEVGMMTSLVLSLTRSRKGWISGGPTRRWSRASTRRSHPLRNRPSAQREQAAGEDDKVENAHKQV